MDLWIRSQDKRMFSKIDYIYLDKNDRELLGGNHYMIGKSLGIYKSKERALEVLDEVQNILKNCQYGYKVNGLGEKVDIIPNQIYVYEMPKE